VRLDVVVVVAVERNAGLKRRQRRSVTLDVLFLWLQILTWLVSHFSSFRKLC